jgi:hypothetical protein
MPNSEVDATQIALTDFADCRSWLRCAMLDGNQSPTYRQMKRRPASRLERWLFAIFMIAGSAAWWRITIVGRLQRF